MGGDMPTECAAPWDGQRGGVWAERHQFSCNNITMFSLVLFYLNKAMYENGEVIPADNNRSAVECSISG